MRIQILPLPSVMVGDDMEEPFALIVDQWSDGAYDSSLQGFADMCGAKAVWVRPETVEIIDRYAETTPSEPMPQAEAATEGTLFGKPIRMEWPEGPPLGLSQQEIGEKLGSTLLKPNAIVLRDRNGNSMNLWATCSCGAAMSMDLATTWRDKTGVVCRGCGNHLTVTCPTDGRT